MCVGGGGGGGGGGEREGYDDVHDMKKFMIMPRMSL